MNTAGVKKVYILNKTANSVFDASKVNKPKKTHKLSEKELMIRKFRKFLYDNDALEAWYKNVRKSGFSTIKGILLRTPDRWVNAFSWVNNDKGADFWARLAIKWDNMNNGWKN